MDDVSKFLEHFSGFGANPNAQTYEELFDPDDGTVLHPGMIEPLHRNGVREYMGRYLEAIPDFSFRILEWAEHNGTLFVEASNSGTVGGDKLTWGTVYCVTLRGDRVLRGRAYADRIPILGRLFPDMTLRDAAALTTVAPGLQED